MFKTKKKLVDIKVEVINPLGDVEYKDIASVIMIDDSESMKHERLAITVLDYTYILNRDGAIIETIKNK
jgi:hypothetical protein